MVAAADSSVPACAGISRTATAQITTASSVSVNMLGFVSRLLLLGLLSLLRPAGNARPMETPLGLRLQGILAVRHWGGVPEVTNGGAPRNASRRFCAKRTKPRRRGRPVLPVRREALVDADLLGVDRDVPARGEVLDDAVHHLARAADALGDVRRRQAIGADARAVLLDRALAAELGEAPRDGLHS